VAKENDPMCEKRFETVLPTGHHLSLWRADITEVAVDAIVNAANFGLVHGGGVAGAIVRKGGEIIQTESDRIGTVRVGKAAVTTAGRLPAKAVIHAVGPSWPGKGPEECDRLLASATRAALQIAYEKRLRSIAYPAISSGIFGFPKVRCAQVMTQAVQDWCAENPDAEPRDIRFTIIDEPTVGFFETEWRTRFGAMAGPPP
jgi:O-acetyl-ADP-ribose deacetylase